MPDFKLWSEQQLSRMRRDMERLFEAMRLDCGLAPDPRRTGMAIEDSGPELVLTLALPGIPSEDMKLTLDDRTLRLFIGKGENPPGMVGVQPACRAITLPCLVDNTRATAALSAGVLTVRLPKADPSCTITVPVCGK